MTDRASCSNMVCRNSGSLNLTISFSTPNGVPKEIRQENRDDGPRCLRNHAKRNGDRPLRHANSRTTLDLYSRRFATKARCQNQGGGTSTAGTGFESSAPFSTFASLKRGGLDLEAAHFE